MIFGFFCNSFRIALIRSSNCPRYLVPATIEAISSATTRLSNNTRETLCCVIRRASPSTIADLPTPGSPISTGLFFLRRLSICANRSISRSRPTIGSSRFSMAALVISDPNVSSAGVSLCFPPVCFDFDFLENCSSSSSSSSDCWLLLICMSDGLIGER